MSIPNYSDFQKHGSDEFLRKVYSGYMQNKPEGHYNVSLLFDLKKLPEDIDELAHRASLLRRNCYASFFHKFFDLHQKMVKNEDVGQQDNCGLIHHHHKETM